jgi:DNA (cytosine-5)-methyltransferase 1
MRRIGLTLNIAGDSIWPESGNQRNRDLRQGDPLFVSLFSGAGGLDIGLEQAGWKCVYAGDNDQSATETLLRNKGFLLGSARTALADAFLERADIRDLTAKEILRKSGVTRGEISLLAGGPPCQSWSSAGHQLGFDDPRGRLFDDFVRVANGLDARWLLLENVRGLLTARGADGQPGSALAHIRQRLLDAGFQTTVRLLNAADFGVAQRRVRLFIIGFRSGDPPPFPEPTHQKARWVPLRTAIESVADIRPDEIVRPNPKLAVELANIPDGRGVKSPGKTERTRPSGHWGYKQGAFIADLDQSARTVTANAQQDWIRDPVLGLRKLAPRECAAIQSFPAGWQFSGGTATQYRLIGNAVPPILARAIGVALLDHVRKTASIDDLRFDAPLPLSDELVAAIRYTAREEASNGESRRLVGKRRPSPLFGVAVSGA